MPVQTNMHIKILMLQENTTVYVTGYTVPGEINTSTYVYLKFWQFEMHTAKG